MAKDMRKRSLLLGLAAARKHSARIMNITRIDDRFDVDDLFAARELSQAALALEARFRAKLGAEKRAR